MAERKTDRTGQELVRALSHPIRVEILQILRGRVASPKELSREMDRSLDVVAYHANTLVRCGCLELVDRKPRHGSVEHFFGITPGSLVANLEWRQAPTAAREAASGYALRTFVGGARRLLSQLRTRSRRLNRSD